MTSLSHRELGYNLYFVLRHYYEGYSTGTWMYCGDNQQKCKDWMRDTFSSRLPDDWQIGLVLFKLSDKELADALESAIKYRRLNKKYKEPKTK